MDPVVSYYEVQIIDHLSAELHFRLPYCIKYGQGSATRQWSRTDSKEVSRPYTEVEVVPKDIPSDYDKKRINVNDSFISFANWLHHGQSAKDVELRAEEPTVSANGAQKVVINNDLEIIFHRTLRMPDDNRLHQLPASLGQFTLFNVEEYADRLPPAIVDRGGIFFPMWQREAMWLGFSTTNDQQQSSLDGTRQHCKYALRIFVGHINAVSGSAMGEKLPNVSHGETKQDYVVVPPQRWVDGICVAPGVVRQFVAMPSKSTSLANLIPLLWHSQRCSYLLVRIDVIVIRKNRPEIVDTNERSTLPQIIVDRIAYRSLAPLLRFTKLVSFVYMTKFHRLQLALATPSKGKRPAKRKLVAYKSKLLHYTSPV